MSRRSDKQNRPAGPPPERKDLHAAAAAHLARFAATERGLAQVLERRILRWGQRATEEGQDSASVTETVNRIRPLAADIAREMVSLGAINDQAFARSRAARLTRGGRSRRAVQMQLAAKGIAAEDATQALDQALGQDETAYETELAAALVLARKRRIGPFQKDRDADTTPEMDNRLFNAFARAGFSRAIVDTVIAMDPEEAEDRILALKANL